MPNQTLINLIANYTDDTNPSIILAELSEKNQVTIDNTMYTYKTLVLRYGIEFSATILGKLKTAATQNPLLDATYYAICSTGIDFSAVPTQNMIRQLTGVLFTQDEADKLEAMGVIKQSILDKCGLTNITVDDISQAIADKKYQRDIINWWVDLHNYIMPKLINQELTKDEVKGIVQNGIS